MSDKSLQPGESNGSGSEPVYLIELKLAQPKTINGKIYTKEWTRVYFEEGMRGVPNKVHSEQARTSGFLSYQAAQALRWWLHADLEKQGAFSAETRIVKYVISYSYKTERQGEYDLIGDSLNYCRPDFTRETP